MGERRGRREEGAAVHPVPHQLHDGACASGRIGYARPGADPTADWTFTPIGGSFSTAWVHGLGAGDIDGDGLPDVMERTGWWQQSATGTWTRRAFEFWMGEHDGPRQQLGRLADVRVRRQRRRKPGRGQRARRPRVRPRLVRTRGNRSGHHLHRPPDPADRRRRRQLQPAPRDPGGRRQRRRAARRDHRQALLRAPGQQRRSGDHRSRRDLLVRAPARRGRRARPSSSTSSTATAASAATSPRAT